MPSVVSCIDDGMYPIRISSVLNFRMSIFMSQPDGMELRQWLTGLRPEKSIDA